MTAPAPCLCLSRLACPVCDRGRSEFASFAALDRARLVESGAAGGPGQIQYREVSNPADARGGERVTAARAALDRAAETLTGALVFPAGMRR